MVYSQLGGPAALTFKDKNMANLYNTDLGGNTRKAKPSSLFGTRQLKFISINLYQYDLYTDSPTENTQATTSYLDSDSLYSRLVTAIQEVAELYYLSAPNEVNHNGFIFAIADETAEWLLSAYGDNNDGTQYPGKSNLSDMILFLLQPAPFGSDPYSIADFDLREMEDCGFGIMPGRFLY
jgi:hypothetical protein